MSARLARKAGGILGVIGGAVGGWMTGRAAHQCVNTLATCATVNARSAETSAGLLMMAGGPIPSGLIPPQPRDALAVLITQRHAVRRGSFICTPRTTRAALVKFLHFREHEVRGTWKIRRRWRRSRASRSRRDSPVGSTARRPPAVAPSGPRRRADLMGGKEDGTVAQGRRRRPRAFDASFATRGGGNHASRRGDDAMTSSTYPRGRRTGTRTTGASRTGTMSRGHRGTGRTGLMLMLGMGMGRIGRTARWWRWRSR